MAAKEATESLMQRSHAVSFRLGICLALLTFAGCECFVPVNETDGGVLPDGGVAPDGGMTVDAGSCNTASDCSGTPSSAKWCANFTPGFSCVEHACVWECPTTGSGRTCSIEQNNYCLDCGTGGDGGVSCPLTGTTQCGQHAMSITVEETTCPTWPGSGTPFTKAQFIRGASARCSWLVHNPDGGEVLGTVWRLDNYEFIAHFPGFGGWCTGRSAFTGLQRSLFSCPRCAFTLEGFD